MTPAHMVPLQVALTHCDPRSTDQVLDAAIPAILADGGIVAYYCDACNQVCSPQHVADYKATGTWEGHTNRRVLIVDAP